MTEHLLHMSVESPESVTDLDFVFAGVEELGNALRQTRKDLDRVTRQSFLYKDAHDTMSVRLREANAALNHARTRRSEALEKRVADVERQLAWANLRVKEAVKLLEPGKRWTFESTWMEEMPLDWRVTPGRTT